MLVIKQRIRPHEGMLLPEQRDIPSCLFPIAALQLYPISCFICISYISWLSLTLISH